MKLLSSLIMILSFSVLAIAQDEVIKVADDTRTVNVESSQVIWTGKKVTGSHTGTINVKSGELVFDSGQLAGGVIVMDMTSISTTDLEGESKAGLDGHLKSEDFFNVESYATAELRIGKVYSAGTDGDYKISGDLTIKGITNPIKFYANVSDDGATADITIDRTEYNVRYGSGGFFENLGDKTIYDEFELKVDLKY